MNSKVYKFLFYMNMAFVGMNVGYLGTALKLGNQDLLIGALLGIGINGFAAVITYRGSQA